MSIIQITAAEVMRSREPFIEPQVVKPAKRATERVRHPRRKQTSARVKTRRKTTSKYSRKSAAYKNWRMQVMKRDGFTCVRCHRTRNLQAHHCMVRFAENKKRRLDVGNGVTLCVFCHAMVHPFMLKDLKEKFGEELVDSEMRWRRERRDAAIRANQIQKQA